MSAALDQILDVLHRHLPELRQRYGVKELAVFGSYVRGQATPHSDLDILVEFEDRPISLFDFIRLEEELSALLGVRVDLVEKTALKPSIGKRILREMVPV